MKTKLSAVILIIFGTLFTTTAQLFYKAGVNLLTLNNWYSNWFIPAGIMFYVVAGILLITALKRGEVSVLYPIFATSFIWVLVFSKYLFGEQFTSQKWIGVGAIIFGIMLISIGSNKPTKFEEAV